MLGTKFTLPQTTQSNRQIRASPWRPIQTNRTREFPPISPRIWLLFQIKRLRYFRVPNDRSVLVIITVFNARGLRACGWTRFHARGVVAWEVRDDGRRCGGGARLAREAAARYGFVRVILAP